MSRPEPDQRIRGESILTVWIADSPPLITGRGPDHNIDLNSVWYLWRSSFVSLQNCLKVESNTEVKLRCELKHTSSTSWNNRLNSTAKHCARLAGEVLVEWLACGCLSRGCLNSRVSPRPAPYLAVWEVKWCSWPDEEEWIQLNRAAD